MKRKIYAIGMVLTLALGIGIEAAQNNAANAKTLYQQALHQEDAVGDLKAAIALYERVLAAKPDRALAAQTLMRMADCYQKLGGSESRKIYQRLVDQYGDQKEAVEARKKLGAAPAEALANVVSSRRVWTAVPKADFYGKASPDGRYIPYTDWNEKGDLFVRDLVTGTNRRITNTASDIPGGAGEYGEEVAFSRDGKQMAYTWVLGNDRGIELRVVSMQGTGVPQPRTLIANPELRWITPFDWSPDNKYIAAQIRQKDSTTQISLISVQDGSTRRLKSVEWRGLTGEPSGIFFSPDGKYLAYDLASDDPTGNHDVFVLATDGSREIPVATHPGLDMIVGWSPDGKEVLFDSDRAGSLDLWSIGFAAGKVEASPILLRRNVGNSARVQNLGITSPGSNYYVDFNPGSVGPDIHLAELDSTEGKFLTKASPAARNFLGTNVFPIWSPDGKYLAFASLRNTHIAIVIRSVETGQINEIVPSPNFPASQGYFHSVIWGPDAKSFIVAAQGNKDGYGVFKIDAQTGETSVILKADNTFRPRQLMMSPDGRALYYLRQERDQTAIKLIKRDLASGNETVLIGPEQPLDSLGLSPDGRYLRVVKDGQGPEGQSRGLLLLSTEDGTQRQLAVGAGQGQYSPDSRYIASFQIDAASKSRVAMLFPLDGGKPRELTRFPDTLGVAVVMWAPDSKSVFLRTSEGERVDLWRVSIDGGKPQKLDLPGANSNDLFYLSPDGRHVAISYQPPQTERKPAEIWAMDNLFSVFDGKK